MLIKPIKTSKTFVTESACSYSDKRGEDLMKAIRQERKVELAHEGHYYWYSASLETICNGIHHGIRLHGLMIEQECKRFVQLHYTLCRACDDKDRNLPTKMCRFPYAIEVSWTITVR
ncbi:RagB/SusD family nutrient uptake outer membrane protein [Bacteroides thetaiotaomicron]|nr:RagB/SusD family nutrient uptake outer membrane protein [Bacteroides thetaiotaomicron]